MVRSKIKEWLKRYLPAEIVGTITAVGAASVAHVFYTNLIIVAYAGTLGEAIGFYSTILIQNILLITKKRKLENAFFSFSDFLKIIRTIILEFGLAAIIDELFVRPFFMYLFPLLLKNFTIGIFVGKIVGDLTFYILVICSYEIRKRKEGRIKLL